MNYASNLSPHLQPLDPTLLTPQTIAHTKCYLVPSNLNPDHGTKGNLRRLLWTQLQLPRLYKKLRSRLIFSPVPEAPIYRGCRYIVMCHDLIPLRFPMLPPNLRRYCRYYVPQVLAGAEHIICNSTATARDITDFFQIPAAKITPIHLAYDAKHFRFLDLPNRLTTGDRPYFLYLGRHDPYKNLHRLVDAFASLPNCRDYELWLAGPSDGRYTPPLQEKVAQLGLTQQVKFLDYVPYEQLPIIINQAIALVFPSLWEGFGFPILEAMACGIPVITSNLSSLPEVTGEAALLINPYNGNEITAAMQAVVTDSALAARLRTLSLKQASQFSWVKTGQDTVEVLKRFL
ncbi:glycosyltransferase [Lyngbya aestuarii]|uniref:glycosyltransferase n=1 Tax=Lyngbya aestuarii TaxID=118322 RepID=UPI00403D9F9D